MIIQREEKDGIVKGFYKSSNVALSEYNKATKDLTITFGYGGVYTYHNVPQKDYHRFELAESQGKVLSSHIKSFTFTKMDAVGKDEVTNLVNEALESEKLSFTHRIVEIMGEIIENYLQNGKKGLNPKLMEELDKTRGFLNKI